jgi:hypothetical protein
MTATHHRSSFSLRVRVARLPPIQTRPPSTTDPNPKNAPKACNRGGARNPRAIPSSLRPMQRRPTEQPPRPILPSQTTPTESKLRSRSTNSCSACASSSNSHSQHRLNSPVRAKKRGSRLASPKKNLGRKPEQNLAFDHLSRCHHTPGLISRRHLPDMHLKHPKHRHTNTVGHQHPHSQRSQHRTHQHNRRSHDRSLNSHYLPDAHSLATISAKQSLLLQIRQHLQ